MAVETGLPRHSSFVLIWGNSRDDYRTPYPVQCSTIFLLCRCHLTGALPFCPPHSILLRGEGRGANNGEQAQDGRKAKWEMELSGLITPLPLTICPVRSVVCQQKPAATRCKYCKCCRSHWPVAKPLQVWQRKIFLQFAVFLSGGRWWWLA